MVHIIYLPFTNMVEGMKDECLQAFVLKYSNRTRNSPDTPKLYVFKFFVVTYLMALYQLQ